MRYLLSYCIVIGCLVYLLLPEDPSVKYLDCRPKSMPTAASTQPVAACAKKATTTAPAGKRSRPDQERRTITERGKERRTAF